MKLKDYEEYLKIMAKYTEGLGISITEMQLELYFEQFKSISLRQLATAWSKLAGTMTFKTLPLPADFLSVAWERPTLPKHKPLQITDSDEYMNPEDVHRGVAELLGKIGKSMD